MAPSAVSGRFSSKAHLPAFGGTTSTTLQYASLSMLMLCRSHKRSHINYVALNDRSWYWQPHACHKPHWTPDSIVRYSAQCLPDYSNYKPNIRLHRNRQASPWDPSQGTSGGRLQRKHISGLITERRWYSSETGPSNVQPFPLPSLFHRT